ncbi:hypothetical protein RB195_003821 [Necator americanus]|uniref:Uncharacterized protein n=1 Tax=Necator americanus TaxID=51031 RepID=A0ABR1DQE9_NECAM
MMANNITRCAKALPPFVIVIILFFNMIFNVMGCLCLWVHQAPNIPEGYADSIRATAALSSAAVVYTLVAVVMYSCRSLHHSPEDELVTKVEALDKKAPQLPSSSPETRDGSKEERKPSFPPPPPLEEFTGNEGKGSKENIPAFKITANEGGNIAPYKGIEIKRSESNTQQSIDKTVSEGFPKKTMEATQTKESLESLEIKSLQKTMDMTDIDYYAL